MYHSQLFLKDIVAIAKLSYVSYYLYNTYNTSYTSMDTLYMHEVDIYCCFNNI